MDSPAVTNFTTTQQAHVTNAAPRENGPTMTGMRDPLAESLNPVADRENDDASARSPSVATCGGATNASWCFPSTGEFSLNATQRGDERVDAESVPSTPVRRPSQPVAPLGQLFGLPGAAQVNVPHSTPPSRVFGGTQSISAIEDAAGSESFGSFDTPGEVVRRAIAALDVSPSHVNRRLVANAQHPRPRYSDVLERNDPATVATVRPPVVGPLPRPFKRRPASNLPPLTTAPQPRPAANRPTRTTLLGATSLEASALQVAASSWVSREDAIQPDPCFLRQLPRDVFHEEEEED